MATTAGNKIIYVSKGSLSFWERGMERAAGQGVSMSKYLLRLVRKDVMSTDRDEITVEQLAGRIAEDSARLAAMAQGAAER